MNERDAEIILAMAEHSMNVSEVGKKLYIHRNTIHYHINKIKKETGLDCRCFYDLCELLPSAYAALGKRKEKT